MIKAFGAVFAAIEKAAIAIGRFINAADKVAQTAELKADLFLEEEKIANEARLKQLRAQLPAQPE